jgi:hypothetical protein
VALRHADDPEPLIAFGRWEGEILAAPRGEGGFGYDPLMFIPALGATVAELPAVGEERAQPPRAGRGADARPDADGLGPVTRYAAVSRT